MKTVFRKALATGTALALGFSAEGCSADTPEVTQRPTAQVIPWVGHCGVNNVLILDNPPEKGATEQACGVALEMQKAVEQGRPVKLMEGNGWFTNPERSACVARPIVEQRDGQGYFAYAQPAADNKPKITLFDLPGSLPDIPFEWVVLKAQADRYAAESFMPPVPRKGGPEPAAQLLQGAACK